MGSFRRGKDDEEEGFHNMYHNLEKTSVLQETRVFNETPVNAKKCMVILTKILYLINQGEQLTAREATDCFSAITKLFQSKDVVLRRMVYLSIKELSKSAEDVIIVTSSLTKDMTGKEDLYRAAAIRALCSVTDATMLQAIERYMKQCIVDKNAAVSCAALVSSLHLAVTAGDVVKRWANEAQEALNNDNIMVQYHTLGLLYHIRKSDRLVVSKLVSKLTRQGFKSAYGICMLIRITCKLIQEEGLNQEDLSQTPWFDFIESSLRHKSEMVNNEAAKAIVNLKQTNARILAPAFSILQLFCSPPKATLRFAAVRTLNRAAASHPATVTTCNLDLESLITDSNRSVATLAITTLLKTGAESSVERLMKQISLIVAEIPDEFKVVVVQAISSLCTKYPRKQAVLMNFLSGMSREEGGLEYKASIVDVIISIIEENADAKDSGLSHLCEFTEDCEHTSLAVRILHLLGKEGPCSSSPSKYIRFIYNRVILENPTVRAAAVTALAQVGASCPALLNNILVLLHRCQMEYDDEEANLAGALEEILKSPERLKDLDLDAFSVKLEQQGFGNKSITWYDIRAELNFETFYVGKMVLVTVIGIFHRESQGAQLDQANPVRNDETDHWQCPFCVKDNFPELSEVWNQLDNGLSGFIHFKDLSDKHVRNPEERVQNGQAIHVRITKFDVERFFVDCSSKSSNLIDKNHEWRPRKDPYYDQDLEDKDNQKVERKETNPCLLDNFGNLGDVSLEAFDSNVFITDEQALPNECIPYPAWDHPPESVIFDWNVSNCIQPNFNFSCNTSTGSLVGANLNSVKVPSKVDLDDLYGYCVMAPINKDRKKSSDSDKENQITEKEPREDEVYENRNGIGSSPWPENEIHQNAHTYRNLSGTPPKMTDISVQSLDVEGSDLNRAHRKSKSIDDKVPSYYTNNWDLTKTLWRKSNPVSDNVGGRNLESSKVSHRENLYISSPHKIRDLRKMSVSGEVQKPSWYEDNWYEVNLENENISCSKEQMKEAAEGHLTTEALMWNQNSHQKTISGMSSEDFRQRLNDALINEGYDIGHNRYPEGYQEAPLAYDAVWSVALAFNKTMERLKERGRSLKDFTYTDKDIADEIYAAMNSTQFLGVSGVVAFSSQGDRIALTQVEQMINGQYIKLGYYDIQADNLTWLNAERWAGVKVPQDRTIVRRVLRTVSLSLFVCMGTISSCGIMVAMALIVFNIWNNHRRVIQSSHPVCNTIMLIGVITCLASVILLGIDGRFVDPETYPQICQTRAWLLSTGFTLAYGAMFSKVWRVHRFTTKAKPDPKKKVEPWKFYIMVSGLLFVDLVILITWQVIDPLQRSLEIFPLENPVSTTDDIKIRPELEHCESKRNSMWLGLVYSYKGLILVFGLFLAYETRSIKVKQINDSRYVGMSIYNVVVLCLITAPVAMVIASQQDASFAFIALAVIFCCFLSMLLIFVPKVIEVIRHPKDKAESKYNPDSGISKEDEERYQKLVSENEELQRLIAQKEEKIRILRQRLVERDQAAKGQLTTGNTTQLDGSGQGCIGGTVSVGGVGVTINTPTPATTLAITQGKDSLIIIQPEHTTTSDFDSAIGGGISVYTRSSRASQSDIEFSESYL